MASKKGGRASAEFKRRSAAAKKAAATRRANVERARRSAAAKKAAATRRANETARARELAKRSVAAKKGWEKRRARATPPSRQSRRVAAGRRTTDVDSLLVLAEASPGFRQRYLDQLRFEKGVILANDPAGRTFRFYVVTNEESGTSRGYWTSAHTFEVADETEPEEVVFGDYERLTKKNVVVDAAWEFTELLHMQVGSGKRVRPLCGDPQARELTTRKRDVTCAACARLMRDGDLRTKAKKPKSPKATKATKTRRNR